MIFNDLLPKGILLNNGNCGVNKTLKIKFGVFFGEQNYLNYKRVI